MLEVWLCRETNRLPGEARNVSELFPEQIEALHAIWIAIGDNNAIFEFKDKRRQLDKLKKKPEEDFIKPDFRKFYKESMVASGYSEEQVEDILRKQAASIKEQELYELKKNLNVFESEEEKQKFEMERLKQQIKDKQAAKQPITVGKKDGEVQS